MKFNRHPLHVFGDKREDRHTDGRGIDSLYAFISWALFKERREFMDNNGLDKETVTKPLYYFLKFIELSTNFVATAHSKDVPVLN
jgi:hypothetical protein